LSEGLPLLHPRVPPQLSRLCSTTMSYRLVVISQDVTYACGDKDALA